MGDVLALPAAGEQLCQLEADVDLGERGPEHGELHQAEAPSTCDGGSRHGAAQGDACSELSDLEHVPLDHEADDDQVDAGASLPAAPAAPDGTDGPAPQSPHPELLSAASVEGAPSSPIPADLAALASSFSTASDAPVSGSAADHQQQPKGKLVREVHPQSEHWGPFYLTWSDATTRPPYGAWQARCPFHRLNEKTACTKSIALKDPGSKDSCRLLLMTWCLQYSAYSRKRDHGALQLRAVEVLPLEVLNSRLAEVPQAPPAREVKTDVELDAEEAAAAVAPSGLQRKGASSRRRKQQAPAPDGAAAALPNEGAVAPHEAPTLGDRPAQKRRRLATPPNATSGQAASSSTSQPLLPRVKSKAKAAAKCPASSSSSSTSSSSSSSDDSDSD